MATRAKLAHLEARRLLLNSLDMHPGKTVHADLDPLEAGIVGDSEHGSGYHLSPEDNRSDDYSRDESPRDRMNGRGYASAMDIGYFSVRRAGKNWDLYDFNAWLLRLIRAGDPDTSDLREVIYSPDGKTVKRWDRLKRRSSGDSSHRTHTHLSEFRNASGQKMVSLARRWLQHIGLLAGGTMSPVAGKDEDDMPTVEEIWAKKAAEYVDENGNKIRDSRTVADILFATHRAALAAADPGAIVAGVLLGLADLPNGTVVTDEQLERVLRKVLGSVDEEPAAT
jgi:hypothetical protein